MSVQRVNGTKRGKVKRRLPRIEDALHFSLGDVTREASGRGYLWVRGKKKERSWSQQVIIPADAFMLGGDAFLDLVGALITDAATNISREAQAF